LGDLVSTGFPANPSAGAASSLTGVLLLQPPKIKATAIAGEIILNMRYCYKLAVPGQKRYRSLDNKRVLISLKADDPI
jgi:hypothetical protein